MKYCFTLFFLLLFSATYAQLLSWTPPFIQENSPTVEIIMDATKGNQGLKDYTPVTDVYVHIAAITTSSANPGDWKYNKFEWGTTNPLAQCVSVGANKWKYTITGGLRNYFGIINSSERILKIALLFRNGAGSRVQRNSDGSDMYVPVYDAALQVRINEPFREPKYIPVQEPIVKNSGDQVNISAVSSMNADLKLYLNGTQAGSTVINGTSITANAVITTAGTQTIISEARSGSSTVYDTMRFFVTYPTVEAPLPAGVNDGINYEPGDTSVTLVLYAPLKTNVTVLGDFNDWTGTMQSTMNKTPDGSRFWKRLTGLTPGVEYAYQYLIDGVFKVADYNTEKVLDPDNDRYIPAVNYPNLKPYPAGKTTGIVSVLQTAKPVYNWQVQNFTRPDKRNLIIYELLVRDFVAAQNWQAIRDTLSYLKRLGINAIELMPFNEFEGNNSWGYNPDFFFAPDKMYGTETALRQFIDECHKQGIAVIMDMVLNHAFGQSPTVQMYWNSTLNRPDSTNPWHNPIAKHPANVGFDFNHESQATKDLVHRVVRHWLTKYKIDGFRWDLSKGFTQTNYCITQNCDQGTDYDNWANYDAGRIATWKRIYDTMRAVDPASYCILEHFGGNAEEKELADYGMMLWGNANHNYNEATMGWLGNSNFQWGIYTNRGWTQPNLITYMESHDEERLMFKNLAYGNSSGSYNVKDTNTALKRNEMAAAFWAMTPAPKMIWQFGELGYGYSINTCENGSISDQCRTSPKPIRWDYKSNANRQNLYNVYSKLLTLRNVPNFLPTFVTNDVSWNLDGAFKWQKTNSDSLKVLVIGNFDVVPATANVTFQNAGIWYNYLNSGTRLATGMPESITLQPGEYHVYLNRNVSSLVAALPLNLISFDASRSNSGISLSWVTANEVNVHSFDVERSFSGSGFTFVGNIPAINQSQQQHYNFLDSDPLASAGNTIFYRLKMKDIDGRFTYSNVVAVNAPDNHSVLRLYPNPVNRFSVIEYKLSEGSNVKLSVCDMSGKEIKTLFSGFQAKGLQRISNGSKLHTLQPGMYVLKLRVNEKAEVKKFLVQP